MIAGYYGYQKWGSNTQNPQMLLEQNGENAPQLKDVCNNITDKCLKEADDKACVPFATQCLSTAVRNDIPFCKQNFLISSCGNIEEFDLGAAGACAAFVEQNCVVYGTDAKNRANPEFVARCDEITDNCVKNGDMASCQPFINTCLATAVKPNMECQKGIIIGVEALQCKDGVVGSCVNLQKKNCLIYGN